MYAVLMADGWGRVELEYPLLLGLSKLERDPEECAVDAAPAEKDQLLCWSGYWYWDVGEGSIMESRAEPE